MTVNQKFGQIIKEKRLEKNLTLEQFGKQLGIAISTLHHYENGDRGVSIEMFFNMCNLLGLDPNEVQKQITKGTKH